METVTIVLSLSALAVSIYGVFERRWAVYLAMRVRITELLSQISDLNQQEAVALKDAQTTPPEQLSSVNADLGLHRALLTYQVVALTDRLERVRHRPFGASLDLTASEHGAFADALSRSGDLSEARKRWDAASKAGYGSTPVVMAGIFQGYADCLFALGDLPSARVAYGEAVERAPCDVAGRQQAFQACLLWLNQELGVVGGAGDPLAPIRRAVAIAHLLPEPLQVAALDELRTVSTTTVYDQDKDEYAERCYLDEVIAMA